MRHYTPPRYNIIALLMFAIAFFISPCMHAQSASFFTGHKTGNIYATGSFLSIGTGNAAISAPMAAHSTGFPISVTRFYYGNNILNTALATPTTLVSSRTLGLGGVIGTGGDAYIQFRNTNNSVLSSGITTYFKIGSAPSITGIGASVGGLLGLSNVYDITGRGYINAGDYTLGNSYNENVGTPVGTAAGTRTQLMIDKAGVWYAAVTPDSAYNAVRLNVALSNTLNLANVGRDMSVTVYNAFYYPYDPLAVDCGTPIFTTPGETQGVSLNLGSTTSLLALDSAISNPTYAIDDDTNTYSRITSGAVGLATAVSQTILFNNVGNSSDVVKMKLALPQSALTAGVLSDLTVTAYNGATQVGSTTSINSLLSLDLLGLLGDNTPFYANFKPNGVYDRVQVKLGNLVNIGANILGGGIRIYGMQRVASAPVITAQPANDTVCAGETAQLNVTASGSSLSYIWQYADNGTWINAGTGIPFSIYNTTTSMNGRVYRVNVTGGVCPTSQATYTSENATLTVRPLPQSPPVSLSQ